MHAVITVTAWSDNTTVYYDHWETGTNFDPANPDANIQANGEHVEKYVLANAGDQQVFDVNRHDDTSPNIPDIL